MKKQIDIQLPTPPNFIKVGEVVIDIADFTDNEIAQMGKEWTEELIAKAHRRRNS